MLINTRSYSLVGIEPFKGFHDDMQDVIFYLLSCLLKSELASSKEFSQLLGVSVRQASRYIYNNQASHSAINMNAVNICLKKVNVSLIEFFQEVQTFMNLKPYSAYYSSLTCTMQTHEQYLDVNLQDIVDILTATRKVTKNFTEDDLPLLATCYRALSKFPANLITTCSKVTK